GNSAALGAALQAATAMGESMGGLVANFAAVDANSATDPNPAAAPIYAEFATRLQALISRCE
ncbi:MAG: sugar (pentulose or hexulose) kinase, partial [Rhodothermales bacterium]